MSDLSALIEKLEGRGLPRTMREVLDQQLGRASFRIAILKAMTAPRARATREQENANG